MIFLIRRLISNYLTRLSFDMIEIEKLLEVMNTLRGESGCNWDKKQTHESLIPYLLEETYEVVDALENKDKNNLKEELGDLLFQIIFHSKIASENQDFDFKDVTQVLTEKLIRRHPHVFKEKQNLGVEEVLQNWDLIKNNEKDGNQSKYILADIPKALPALLRAEKIQKKVSKVGFDWEEAEGIFQKIEEEINELKEELNTKNRIDERIEEELGDILFSVINLSRFLNINPEKALRKVNRKFESRFQFIEDEAYSQNKTIDKLKKDEMEDLWQKSKKIGSH